MRIAYCGNFKPSFSTESHISKTLEAMGHEVVRIQEDDTRPGDVFPMVRSAALFLFTRTWGRTVTHGVLAQIKDAGIPTVSYHLDLYIGLERNGGIGKDPFWNTDFVFTPDGGSQARFEELGINHIYMKPGVYQPECYLGTPRPEWAFDVIFVGSYNYHPEWPYRRQLIDWLKATYGARFERFAGDTRFGTVREDALNDLYASAKIAIGDSLCLGFNHPHYWSDRVYETLGRGGFLIHPLITGMTEEFEDGVHLRYYSFREFEQLKRLIDYFLVREDERLKVLHTGHEKVKRECTYTNRLQRMFEILRERKVIS